MQSVPITTNGMSLESSSGEVCLIQHYVIKFVGDLRQVSGFPVSSTNKTDRHNITEILLKVVLNTINQNPKAKIVSLWGKIDKMYLQYLSYFCERFWL